MCGLFPFAGDAMSEGKIDPKIAAAVGQLRGDFDAARGIFEKAISDLRSEFNEAQRGYDAEIAGLKEEIDALRERLLMVAGPSNKI